MTILVLIIVILVNILFGYWRSNTKKLSIQWVLAIHVPVIISIVLRLTLLEWNWWMLPIFIIDFSLGQYLGGYLRKMLLNRQTDLGSFLLKDLYTLFTTKLDPD